MRQRPLVTLIDSPATIKLLQEELLTCGETYKVLSLKSALAVSTISNIASGQTKLPRLETVIRILSVLGWTVMARRDQ